MATKIEWTDETWNPIRGCSRVSEGCRNCYAEKMAYRFSGPGQPYEGLVQLDMHKSGMIVRLPQWNGKIKFVEEHLLDPLRWKKPRRIFVNSMSDLFHENVTDEMMDKIFAVMALCPQHTFQVLTKRPERMLAYLSAENPRYTARRVFDAAEKIDPENGYHFDVDIYWPLSNVQLGVSVEDQKTADKRIPLLLQTPAAVRFISAEPLLGPVNLGHGRADGLPVFIAKNARMKGMPAGNDLGPIDDGWYKHHGNIHPWLDWIIVGGESGPGARPMHPDWARSLRDQCVAAGVPFFFKQWGEWTWSEPVYWSATPELAGKAVGPFRPSCVGKGGDRRMMCRAYPSFIPGRLGEDDRSFVWIWEAHRTGKKAAGHLLDGKEWHQFPEVSR